MNYQDAVQNIQTIAELKEFLSGVMAQVASSPKFDALNISPKDYDDFLKMQDENVDEMAWEAIKRSRRIIEEYDRAESKGFQREVATIPGGFFPLIATN